MSLIKLPAFLKAFGSLAAVAFVVAMASPAVVDGATITRVEEDWELVIATPSPTAEAPQVTCGISPTGNLDGLHATFSLNHHKMPEIVGGGLQLQTWDGRTIVDSKKAPTQALLATPNETIRWTQVMSVNGGVATFEILNGTSTTWGEFGNDGTLKIVVPGRVVSDLSGYSPATSVANSGVSFAANRVTSLVLKRVRIYTSTGQVTEDTTPRVVHPLAE
jgi:hypothetical protein